MRSLSAGPVTGASVLLLAVLAVLWPRSYWHGDLAVLFHHRGMPLVVGSHRGGVGIFAGTRPLDERRAWSGVLTAIPAGELELLRIALTEMSDPKLSLIGFTAAKASKLWVESDYVLLIMPHWFAGLLVSLPLLVAARRWRELRRRLRHGLCLYCGYDLRATPQRCPECGRSAEPQAHSGAEA